MCDQCDYSTTVAYSLVVHIDNNHGVVQNLETTVSLVQKLMRNRMTILYSHILLLHSFAILEIDSLLLPFWEEGFIKERVTMEVVLILDIKVLDFIRISNRLDLKSDL